MSNEAVNQSGNIFSRGYHAAIGGYHALIDGFQLVGNGIADGVQAVGHGFASGARAVGTGYRATGDFFKGKGFATVPTAALISGEIAVAEVVEDYGTVQTDMQEDALRAASYAFVLDTVLTAAAKGAGLEPERRRGVRRTVNFVSALGGSLIQLATTGRLDSTQEVETATPASITNVVLGVASFVGAWLGNAAGRGLTRPPVRR